MNGTIMIARMMPAASMPTPYGGPWKSGRNPRDALNDGIAAPAIPMIMAVTRRISERAAPRANPRNSRSPQPRLARAETTVEERDRLAAAVVILLACRQERLALVGDLPEPRLDLLHDLGRQWRVEEIRRVLLAVVDHPPEELHQQLALRLVGLVFLDEEPREARD